MVSNSSVIVVGGGVIGCSIAYHLARGGARVTVVEQGRVGGGASSVAAGMIAALSEGMDSGEPLKLALESRSQLLELLPRLQAESGVDVEYLCPGIIHTAFTAEEETALMTRLEWQGPLGMDVRWLSAGEALQMEPALGEGVRGALFSPQEGHVNSRRLVRAFAQAAARKGVTILQDTPVIGLLTQGTRVTGVTLASGEAQANWVVLASGAWSGRYSEWLGVDVPVRPVKGQILAARVLPTPISRGVWRGLTYLLPKADGSLVIGTTREDAEFNSSSTLRGIATILRRAIDLVPAIAGAQLHKTWAGLRPSSPDELPILGPVQGWDGVLLATGHYRSGILLSTATGSRLANYILKGDEEPLRPFHLSRFA